MYKTSDSCSAYHYCQEGEGPSGATLSRSELRMRNSDVLANLDKKLPHLPLKERAEVVNLITTSALHPSQIHQVKQLP